MPPRKSDTEVAESDRERMIRLTGGLPTKAAKVRRLAEAGFSRGAIAKFLGISYQHVRNVLTQPRASSVTYEMPPPSAGGMAEANGAPSGLSITEFSADIGIARFVIDAQGRITLTPELLAALQARPGGLVTARLENGELIVMGIDASIRFAQSLITPWKPGEPLWSEELIAERRAEAAREAAEARPWKKRRS